MVDIRYIQIILITLLFTGCASPRQPAVVEDRTLPEQESQPQQKQQAPQDQPRVYKLEEPEYIDPEPLPETTVEERSAPVPLDEPAPQKGSPAVVALLDDADRYATTGKNQEAIASIERALRIEPKNPLLWNKLGQIHLQQGKWEQAIATAKKSNVLAAGNRLLQSENWMIIAKANEGKGDKAGATHAYDMAKQLRTY